MVLRRGKVCAHGYAPIIYDRGTESVVVAKERRPMNMGAILALIIIVVFGISLLVYFHFEDKKIANSGL